MSALGTRLGFLTSALGFAIASMVSLCLQDSATWIFSDTGRWSYLLLCHFDKIYNAYVCPALMQNVISYSLYIREVGAESKNFSKVTPVTCFDVNGDLQMTVRWSRGKVPENQLKSIGLAFPPLTSMKSLSGVTKSISCSFEAQKPVVSGWNNFS